MLDYLQAAPDVEDANGREGSVRLIYAALVQRIGPPNREDDPDKVSASWGVRGPDGAGFSVWNYKYPGHPETCNSWSIGYPDDDPKHRELARRVFGTALER